jgi:energy-coupling factor transporter ATP-binding protein EcfA2
MVAAKITAPHETVDQNNVFKVDDDLSLLKCAAIYGANGSGKSNLAAAFTFMRRFVLTSSKESQSGEGIRVEEFRLSDDTKGKPSFFEIVFLVDGTSYRYGFEVDKKEIHAEWLFHAPKAKEAKLFERQGGSITASRSFKEARGLEDKTRSNALFLSVLAQFNGPIAKVVLQWFRSLNIISGLNDLGYRRYTVKCFHNNMHKEEILTFIKELDLGFEDISVEGRDESPVQDTETKKSKDDLGVAPDVARASQFHSDLLSVAGNIKTTHRSFNAQGEPTSLEVFDIDTNESEGTRKLFFLAGPLMDTLKHGRVLFIDEFDARLHPLITHEIIRLFNSTKLNRNNAQLIFATHDTNLLSNKLFRRDQIWFTEKDKFGATHLHSLVEYKIRNDASFEKDYINGKYGAIPFIGNLGDLFGASDGQSS